MAKKAETDESESELTFEKLLYDEFQDLNKQLAELKEEAKEFQSTLDEVKDIIYCPSTSSDDKQTVPKEFEDPENFRKKLDNLHKYVGTAIDYVLKLEKQRPAPPIEQILEPKSKEEESERPMLPVPAPINLTLSQASPVTAASSPQKFGLFAFLDEREKRKMAEKALQIQDQQQQPVVSTTKIVDVVEYGRQLQPAFNTIKKWFFGTLAEVQTYPDKYIYFIRHEELAVFLGQTLGSLDTWVSACLTYRKNLIEGRKLGLWRAVAKIAEAQSMAPQIQTGGTFMPHGLKLSKEGFEAKKE